jgi:restriction endonuclease S subunit
MTIPDYVFSVRPRSLEKYWEVRSVRISLTNRCNWPTESLNNICSIRFEVVPVSELETRQVQFLDRISFDEGKVFFGNRTQTKMTQYRAKGGDIAVSKINARKRAIGIVPDGVEVGLTIHFRALIPDTSKIDRQYLWLTLRSGFCRNQFDIETGGIGKGEISEERLLDIHVPLPPLDVQRTIVACWQAAQEAITKTENEIPLLEEQISEIVYQELGVAAPKNIGNKKKLMILHWKEMDRWSFNYIRKVKEGALGFTQSKYPVELLGSLLIDTMNGYCIKPVQEITPFKMLKLNALTPSGLNLTATKQIKVTEKIARNFHITKNDLMICRSVGSYSLIAKCAVVEETAENILFPDIMIRVRLGKRLLPEYVRELIQTPLGRDYFQSNARTAVGMWKIGAQDIINFPIPVPSIEVQQNIIDRLQEKRAEIAQQREQSAQIRQEAEAEVEALILGTKG